MPLSAQEVSVLDGNAAFLGVPASRLMENAGTAVAEAVRKRHKLLGQKVVVLCGPGNNGGDGFVAARQLMQYCQIRVCLIRPPEEIRTDIARANYEKIKRFAVHVQDAAALRSFIKESTIIIDALLGVGFRGPLKDEYRAWIQEVNRDKKIVVSVDVPSGLGSEPQVTPSMTVTFHDIKDGMSKKNSGEIVVADIGIPGDAQKYTGPGEFVYYPVPQPGSHKGENGRVVIVGGGPYTGAPALAGLAAYRTGADLVRILAPKNAWRIISSYSPDFIVQPLSNDDKLVEGDIAAVLAACKGADALLIGPGLGLAKETKRAVCEIIRKCEIPIAIDADAIAAVSSCTDALKGHAGVITPHHGEFYDLTGKRLEDDMAHNIKSIEKSSRTTGLSILCKGRIDIITDGSSTKLNRTGNQGMTVGGTGDVLAGIVVALLAKKVPSYHAARIAAFTSGYAGDLALKELSFGFTASDVCARVPLVLREFLKQ